MTPFTLTFCTNYNGVHCNPTDDDYKVSKELYVALDHISDTFPGQTYEMVDKFDTDLSEEQENHLCKQAEDIIRPLVSDVKVEFEYDDSST